MISVVILTLNEAQNLPRCIASVSWCDDIIVVDSGSSDDTVNVAKSLGARILERKFDNFASQRNFAMKKSEPRNRWVLHLDADEEVTPELRRGLRSIAEAEQPSHSIWRVPFRLIFMGRWLKHAGMYPSYQVRFGRANVLRFVEYGHGQREAQPSEEVGTIDAPIDHYNFSKGVGDWLSRHIRYARAEADQALMERAGPLALSDLFCPDSTERRRALKRLSYRVPFRPLARFAYVYFMRFGFLDGLPGYHYARLMGIYQYLIDLQLKER